MVFASRDSGCESHRFVGSGHSNLFFDPFADHPRYPWPDEQVAYADSCQSPLGIAVLHTCKVQLKGVAEVCLPLERQFLLALFCFCYLGLVAQWFIGGRSASGRALGARVWQRTAG